jgi:hypothetical protein
VLVSCLSHPYRICAVITRFTLFLLIAYTFGACATSTPIRRYSESKSAFNSGPQLMSHNVPTKDIYRIYHRASSGFNSMDGLRQDVENRATDFCERQSKSMVVLGEKISQPPYILGNFPRIELVFAAVDKPKSQQRTGSGTSRYDDLRKLKELHDSDVLTDEEYEREKRKILNAL